MESRAERRARGVLLPLGDKRTAAPKLSLPHAFHPWGQLPEWKCTQETGQAPEFVVNLGGHQKERSRGFPGGAVVKNPPANAGHTGSSPGPGRRHMPRSN